jgi:DNA/RNA endonuclease YhcR with UshA esterase domain
VALRGVEWSHDEAGHINVLNTNTLLSRTDPRFDELSEIYTWLVNNPDVVAQFNHPDPSYGGTFDDFAFHPAAARVITLQEIGNNAQRYTTYEPSFIQSNTAGWKTGPTINGDTHVAEWGTDTPARTGLVATSLTEAALVEAMRARRVFATEDPNLALAVRGNDVWMGSVLTTTGPIALTVNVVDPDPEPITLTVVENNLPVDTVSLTGSGGEWTTTVQGLPGHFYWVKATQADGDQAYSTPIWIEGQAPPIKVLLNEVMPAPYGIDWDGSGVADGHDEWLEILNLSDRPVGLGGWRLQDAAGVAYTIPLDTSISAGGYAVFYHQETGIGLNNGGDTMTLIDPKGTVVDTMSYDHSPGSRESWCRLPDGGSSWGDACDPSPGSSNSESYRDRSPAEPLRVKIYEAKQLTPGAWVEVEGRVTAPPGVLGSRTMYIQDDTAGIKLYLPKDHRLVFNLGDKVSVEGNLRLFHEEFEIDVDERGDIDQEGTGSPPPALPIVTTSLLEPYEGMLIQLQGQAVRFRGRTTLWLDDGTDPAKVVIRRSTGIRKPFIELGAPVTAIGIASQYSDKANPKREDYRLLPRFPHDLIWPTTPPPEPPSDRPKFLPETGY